MPHLAKIKAPFGQEKVYKEECTFSFDNPVSIENSRDGINIPTYIFVNSKFSILI